MDPDETLRQLREAVTHIDAQIESGDFDLLELASHIGTVVGEFQALDEWLTKGGFAPQAWSRTETPNHTPEKKQ